MFFKVCFLTFFVTVLSLFSNDEMLSAQIVQVDRIEQILPHIKDDMLVIFDLDNTLIQTKQDLGSDQWFTQRINTLLREEGSHEKARQRLIEEYNALVHLAEVKVVEDETLDVFEKIKKNNSIMAQTARSLVLHWVTKNHLRSCGIDFSQKLIHKPDVYFRLEREALWQEGILFSQGMDKGNTLFHFFSLVDYKPKAICFIDDKLAELEKVQRECDKRKIPFLGLRYSYLDEKVKNFTTDKTDRQISLIKRAFHLNDDALEEISKQVDEDFLPNESKIEPLQSGQVSSRKKAL